MIVPDFTDPVLAIETRDLVHRDRVVVEAEPVRGQAIQSLIDDAGACVYYGLVVDGVRDS